MKDALITGDVYKPSDRRIKSDFVEVDTSKQLDHIRNLQIYDYKIKGRSERGGIHYCYTLLKHYF